MRSATRSGTLAASIGLMLALLGVLAFPIPSAGESSPALTDDEADGIRFVREEEKLARDVYLNLGDEWGVKVFSNIVESEQRHMDAVLKLIESYDMNDPAAGNQVGVFTDPALQDLYDELIARGGQSLEDALRVGAFIEEWDIADLVPRIEATDKADIQQVYDNLLKGSRNHLRAFDRQLERNGFAPYVTEVLDQATYDAIANEPMERGSR